MTEIYQTTPGATFLSCLTDAAMLEPSSIGTSLLFDPVIFDIRQMAEGGLNNAMGTISLPLSQIILIVGTPYGKRLSYMSQELDEDWMLSIRLTILSDTGASIDDTLRRIHFATKERRAVFSSYGINDVGIDEHPRYRPFDEKRGLTSMDYTMRFRWAEQT